MRQFVIWSFDNNAWWRPDRQGYTTNLDEAGIYDMDEAASIQISSVLLEDIAILLVIAKQQGAPLFHTYNGRT